MGWATCQIVSLPAEYFITVNEELDGAQEDFPTEETGDL